jgi:D-sedoheptulose 7-phosphate isomerase
MGGTVREIAEKYYEVLFGLKDSIQVTDPSGQLFKFYEGIERAGNLIQSHAPKSFKLIFIGNGASAAISSHMATDFWKNVGIRAMAFNDSSLLTCVGNDFGYEKLFEKPIEMFADPGDILMAISSSGRSVNILNGVKAARRQNCRVITFSGFQAENPLRLLGDLNFYVPANAYGPVEILHHSICHCLLDILNKIGR